jgi:hypothetical protein
MSWWLLLNYRRRLLCDRGGWRLYTAAMSDAAQFNKTTCAFTETAPASRLATWTHCTGHERETIPGAHPGRLRRAA